MSWIRPIFSKSSDVQPPSKRPKLDSICAKKIKNIHPKSEKNLNKDSKVSWIDKFEPESKDELVVHKKKIEEVECWIRDGVGVLVLTGSPGCGKMTTVKVLCKHFKVGLSEWVPPLPQEYNPDCKDFTMPYVSQAKMFEEFTLRASRYGSILNPSMSKRIIFVKDIPNQYIRDPGMFHDFIYKISQYDDLSICFVFSDNSTFNELFSEEVKKHASVKVIQFNPVTKRGIASTLSRIIKKANLSHVSISQSYIDKISESADGDLRNAITSLQFLMSEADPCFSGVKKEKFSKNSNVPLIQLMNNDPSIDIFHGLGRVLYAKRGDNKVLVHNPNEIAEAFSGCANFFTGMLHENYLGIFSSIKSAKAAINCMAYSDNLLSDYKDLQLSREIAMCIGIHGLMVNNDVPIKKFQHFSKSKYPQALNLCSTYKSTVASNFNSIYVSEVLLDGVSYYKFLLTGNGEESKAKLVKELCGFNLINRK